jgi:outer membrane protein
MVKAHYYFLVFLLSFSFTGYSQTRVSGSDDGSVTFTLLECIDYALKNNVDLRRANTQTELDMVQLQQSRWAKYPTVNGQFNLNGNTGRNIDPFSNSIVTQTIGTNNLGVSANVTVFDGFRNRNTVARNTLSLEATKLDVESQRNDIMLQISLAYLNVLSTEDLIEVARKQLEVTKLQLERTQKLVDGGALPETNLFDLTAQQANDELQLINAENNHESAILSLKQAMNAPIEKQIKVSRMNVPDPNLQIYPQRARQVYDAALGFLPQVKATAVRILAADKSIEIARSVGLPTVTAGASWGSAYSTVAKELIDKGTIYNPITVSAEFEGQTIPFVVNFPSQSYDQKNIAYFNQINNNQNLNVGLSARIPIFNGHNSRYQTQIARVQKVQAELMDESVKLTIRQNIDKAYIDMLNAQKRYSATLIQVQALELSFKAADSRYNAGASNFVDYNLAKTNLDRAKSNLIVAKYDYIFRTKILDFYQNKPIEF